MVAQAVPASPGVIRWRCFQLDLFEDQKDPRPRAPWIRDQKDRLRRGSGSPGGEAGSRRGFGGERLTRVRRSRIADAGVRRAGRLGPGVLDDSVPLAGTARLVGGQSLEDSERGAHLPPEAQGCSWVGKVKPFPLGD
jgi:hypothetical protein